MAATDLDLDALLDALSARARQRAEAVELRNAAGDVVTPLASTGRLTVNPGDVIASVWGNTTYDQTIQAFDTPAARDAQWPTPKDGAAAYTADTGALWLRRAGAWVSPPRGFVSSALNAAFSSASGPVMALTASLVAGRRYRVSAFSLATQQAAAGNPLCTMTDSGGYFNGNLWRLWQVQGLIQNANASGGSSRTLLASASASVTFTMNGSTTAGNLSIAAGWAWIDLEDIGG